MIEAAITWAEAEANKLNRLDLAVGRVIGGVVAVSLVAIVVVVIVLFINPLRNGVAAGELDRETANPGHVILRVLVVVAILDTTGLGEKLTAHSGVGRETITLDGFKTLLANCGGSGKGGCGDDALHG